MPAAKPKSSGSDTSDGNQIEAWRNSIDRNEFFAALFFLCCANGIASSAIASINRIGWFDSVLVTFDVSAIVLAACATGLWLTACRRGQPVAPLDLSVAMIVLALIALPIGGLGWIAVSGLALYVLFFTEPDPRMRRGALVLLATTVPVFWSRLLFKFFANFILQIDASFVGWLLGTERTGNMVRFANDDGYLVIFPPCSSIANMSLAFLGWITVSALAGRRRTLSDLWWCLLVCGSVLAINVVRMSLMGISLEHYEAIHGPIGNAVSNAMILLVILGWSLLGVRRDLFSRT